MACGAENESDCPPAVSQACQWGGVTIFHAGQATANNIGVGDLQAIRTEANSKLQYKNGTEV